jgi:flagellar protein FlaG
MNTELNTQTAAMSPPRRSVDADVRIGGVTAPGQPKAVERGDRSLPEDGNAVPMNSPGAPTAEQLEGALEDMTKYFQNVRRELDIRVDDDTGVTVIKVMDTETHEVIRQIPPEELLELARHLASDSEEKINLLQAQA